MRLSVSVTTRRPRPGEVDGHDYHFVDLPEFERRRDAGEFLEWAVVFSNHYATPRAEVEASLAEGHDLLFDIDWQGARQIAEAMPDDVVRVFLLPPSAAVLGERLRQRAQDSEEEVARRMARAADEIDHWHEYDFVIVNDDLDRSTTTLGAILAAERHARRRQIGLERFVRQLQKGL